MFRVPARQIVRSGVRYFKTVEKAVPEDLTAPLFAAVYISVIDII